MSAPGQILLDSYARQPAQWCWRPAWHIHGESAWSLFSKFAVLNQLTARELVHLVINTTCRKRTAICNKPDVDLREGALFDLGLLTELFRVPKSHIRHAFLFEVLPGSVLRSYEHLRWCDACMSRGFHSPLFQMKMTRHCPIHGHALLDCCQRCERQVAYRLNKEFMLQPFKCPHCAFDFAPTMSEARPDTLRLREDEITRLALLLKFHRTANADLISVSDAQGLFRNAKEAGIAHISIHECDVHAKYASFITQVLEDVAPGLRRRQKGLLFEPVMRQVCGNWRTLSFEDDDEYCDCGGSRGNENMLNESQQSLASCIDTYKALRRYLWRRTFKKHQRCIRSATDRLWWHIHGEKTTGFCPHALAFIRWRMLWEGCGTPRYLFAHKARDYHGIIGWHLARPSPAPKHWSVGTKAWISSHIFGSTCLAALSDILGWAKSMTQFGTVNWDLQRSPVSYTCLWAVAGKDCRDRPAVVYLRRTAESANICEEPRDFDAHWHLHKANISLLHR